MIGRVAFQAEPAKPPIGKVEIDLLAQPPFRANAKAIADERACGSSVPDRSRAALLTIERRQFLTQTTEIEKPVDLPQQVLARNPIL